jgi:hypothetical protein
MRAILFVMLTALLVAAGCAGETTSPPEAGSDAGAPDFSVETFDDGTFSLAEQKGRIVVLNFFESW